MHEVDLLFSFYLVVRVKDAGSIKNVYLSNVSLILSLDCEKDVTIVDPFLCNFNEFMMTIDGKVKN